MRLEDACSARDHFGVRLFYYATLGDVVVFSNSLDCLRLHPRVSDKMNELAIVDFLLVGLNQDLTTTAYADIRRLPPGHTLVCVDGATQSGRYWGLPVEAPLHYQHAQDYVEHFRQLLRSAVADRLRVARASITLSGGLDSPCVAATANALLDEEPRSGALHGISIVHDWLIPDEERHFVGLISKHLNLPVHFIVADNYRLFERFDQPEPCTPEPVDSALGAVDKGDSALATDFTLSQPETPVTLDPNAPVGGSMDSPAVLLHPYPECCFTAGYLRKSRMR